MPTLIAIAKALGLTRQAVSLRRVAAGLPVRRKGGEIPLEDLGRPGLASSSLEALGLALYFTGPLTVTYERAALIREIFSRRGELCPIELIEKDQPEL